MEKPRRSSGSPDNFARACQGTTWRNHRNVGSRKYVLPGAKFETPGTFAYVCGIHPSMTGTVEVTP